MAHVIRISYELALSTLSCVKARIATEAGYIACSYTRVLQRSLLLTCWMPVTSSSHIAAETPQCTGSSQVLPRYYCDHHKVTPSTSLVASWQVLRAPSCATACKQSAIMYASHEMMIGNPLTAQSHPSYHSRTESGHP